MATTDPKPLKIFCSYSHKDEEHLNDLRDWLRGLERQGLIKWWHDREIVPGWEWEEAIDKNLRAAEVILFLVTPDFMASDYVYEKEIDRAIEKHERGEARVIPIIVRPAHWKWASFGKLHVLPKDATPITRWDDRDDAWFDVVEGIQKAVEELMLERQGRVAKERYRKAVEEAWTDDKLDDAEAQQLGALASELGLGTDSAADIERDIMGATKEATLERQDQDARKKERKERLEGLYDRARELHQNQEWQAVVDVFEQIRSEEPAYPDPEALLVSAREALETQKPVPSPMVEIPDLSGQRIAQARSTLSQKGLRLGDQNEGSSDTVPEGQIIEQSPEAGRQVQTGTPVSVTVSSGPPSVKVPDLVGKSRDEARNTLNNVGLELGAQAKVRSDDIPEGRIIKQSPEAGRRMQAGSLVNITVSSRLPPQPELPALAGSWWALFLRGLVLAIFGLALLVMPTVLNATGGGYFRLVSAIVMILDWIFATIDAQTTRASRRRWLLIQGRISFLLGLFTFVTWVTLVTGLIDLTFARYLVGSWAIVIGIFRIAAAIQLRWETKNSLLMGASSVLLTFFGMGALLLPASTFWWRPLGPLPLASGITLIAFALLWVWNRERSGAGE